MLAFLIGIGAATIAGTCVTTAVHYGDLPDRIAIHFGIDGTANGYAPRFAAWLLVGLQLFIAAAYVFAYAQAGSLTLLVIADCALAICWRAQTLIIAAAISGTNRIGVLGFGLLFAVVLTAGIVAGRFV